jgi:hypothetical protein
VSRSQSETKLALASGRGVFRANGTFHEFSLPAWASGPDLSEIAVQLKAKDLPKSVRVVLSAVHAPVWLVSAPPVRLSTQEMQGWVYEAMTERFGDLVASWELCWDYPPPGEEVLVCAIKKDFLSELRGAIESANKTLASVEPWVVAALRLSQRELQAQNYWIALAETGRLSLARMSSAGQTVQALVNFPRASAQDLQAEMSRAIVAQCLVSPQLAAQEILLIDLTETDSHAFASKVGLHQPRFDRSALELLLTE